jgi:predicted NAD/FAD-dependent oxidoreductase
VGIGERGDDREVLHERYLHRTVVTHGAPTAAGGGLTGRPSVDALGLPGVYLAGDWVGAEGLLADAAAASGIAAARAAVLGRANIAT